MHHATQLQFKQMAPEAQRAALQRLALRGTDIEVICKRTGLCAAEVQRELAGFNSESNGASLWRTNRASSREGLRAETVTV